MTLKELVTTWGFDIDDEPLRKLSETFNVLKEQTLHLIEFFGEETVAIWELAERTAQTAQETSNLAQSMGTTTQEIQKLEYAAKYAGISAEDLQMSLRRVNVMAGEAAMGNEEASLAFSRLGISVADGSGKLKTSTELMKEISGAFQRLPDGVMKSQLAFQLLGRRGMDFLPVLNQGPAKLKELGDESVYVGYTMSNLDIMMGVKFKQTLHELEAIFEGITRTVGKSLLPVFISLMEQVRRWYEGNRDLINQDVQEFINLIADSLKNTFNVVTFLVWAVGKLTDNFNYLMPVLKVVAGLMLGFTAMTTVLAIGSIIEAVVKLGDAFKIAAFFESLMSGGANILAGLATWGGAAVAIGAGVGIGSAAWMLSPHASPSTMRFNGMGSAPDRFPGLSGASTGPGIYAPSVTQHNNFILPQGTSLEHANQVAVLSDAAWRAKMRSAAEHFQGGQLR